jgi:glutamate dehydrogenase (NAD(P)+)
VYDEKGIDILDLYKYRQEKKSVKGYPKGKVLADSASALELDCDILIPAALEKQITEKNAARIKAKIIAEAANGPITPAAEKILNKKGVMIIPDIYVNAGGVTVSYFEWLKNLSHVRFGRMQKRWEERHQSNFIKLIEDLTGKTVPKSRIDSLIHGADEIDLVNSGLEDTMINAYRDIREFKKRRKNVEDLRTAAFAVSINKIRNSYYAMGIFP